MWNITKYDYIQSALSYFNIPIQLVIFKYGFIGHYVFVINSEACLTSLKVEMKRMGAKNMKEVVD